LRRAPHALALAGLLLLAACKSTPDPPQDMELKLNTQAEADTAAKSHIDKSNADAEFEKLQAEINGQSKP
jgi:hypothetical protein